jgi:hypothetical protein
MLQRLPRGRKTPQSSRVASQRSPALVAGAVRRTTLTTAIQATTVASRALEAEDEPVPPGGIDQKAERPVGGRWSERVQRFVRKHALGREHQPEVAAPQQAVGDQNHPQGNPEGCQAAGVEPEPRGECGGNAPSFGEAGRPLWSCCCRRIHAATAGTVCCLPVSKRGFLEATLPRTYNSNAGSIEMAFPGDP